MKTSSMEWQEAWERAQQRADDLQVERDRLAEALGKIADRAKYLSEPAWDREGCALVGATIYRWAAEALSEAVKEGAG